MLRRRAGYTNYPSEWGANTDGIAQARIRREHWHEQSVPGRTLTHECGHWLNLPHTWGSTNNPNQPDNCDSDDGVEDSPLSGQPGRI